MTGPPAGINTRRTFLTLFGYSDFLRTLQKIGNALWYAISILYCSSAAYDVTDLCTALFRAGRAGYLGENMNCTYNIYRQLAGQNIVWVDRVNDLDQATERIRGLRANIPGHYLIYDVRERAVVRVWPAN